MFLLLPALGLGHDTIRPAAEQVTIDILRSLDILDRFTGSLIYTSDATAMNIAEDANGRINVQKDYAEITIAPIINPRAVKIPKETSLTTPGIGLRSTDRRSEAIVWGDNDTDITITALVSALSIQLDIALHFKSEDYAYQTSGKISARYPPSMIHTHRIDYMVPIPRELFGFWTMVYERTNRFLTPQETLMGFIMARSQRPMKLLQRAEGQGGGVLCYSNALRDCVGIMEFSQERPEVEKEGNAPTSFTVQFSYTFQLERMDGFKANYPAVIGNEFSPIIGNLHSTMLPVTAHDPGTNDVITGNLQQMFRKIKNYPELPVRVPYFESAEVGYAAAIRYGYHPFFIASLTVDDPDEGTCTIDLNDLAGYGLSQTAISALIDHGPELLLLTGLFAASVLVNGQDVRDDQISIEGSVIKLTGLKPLDRHVLVLSDATKLRTLNRAWVPWLVKYRFLFSTVIGRHVQALAEAGIVRFDPNYLPYVSLFSGGSTAMPVRSILYDLVVEGYASPEVLAIDIPSFIADYVSQTKSLKSDMPLSDIFLERCMDAGIVADVGVEGIQYSIVSKNQFVLSTIFDQEAYDGFIPSRTQIYFAHFTAAVGSGPQRNSGTDPTSWV